MNASIPRGRLWLLAPLLTLGAFLFVACDGSSAGGEDVLADQTTVVRDTVGGEPIVVFFAAGTVSALDRGFIADSRDVGATGVFRPLLDGRTLTFRPDGYQIVDEETASTWNVLGRATDGPLKSRELTPIVHGDHFWFAWAIFKPSTRIYQGD
jgi:hypothetical protein